MYQKKQLFYLLKKDEAACKIKMKKWKKESMQEKENQTIDFLKREWQVTVKWKT